MRFQGRTLYNYIGQTKGYGTLHLTEGTISLIKDLLARRKIDVGHKFGDGPSWRMRLIRTAGELLGFDSDFLLKHSFARSIYFVPLAENSKNVLNGTDVVPKYFDYPLNDLVGYWRSRWLTNRKKDRNVISQVTSFTPRSFELL